MISVRNLSFNYKSKKVLDDINFDVQKGAFLGVLGENGAGKSTLLEIISKILKPYKGEILIAKKDINFYSLKEIAKIIAFVGQGESYSSNIPFLVSEIILMGRSPHLSRFQRESKKDIEIVNNAMQLTNVLKFKSRFINELSGGERQRVVIARALAQEPKILLLDEPVSNLDIRYQIEILNLIKNLSRNGITVVCVMHDLNLAAMFCDTLLLLSNGKILANGMPEEVLTTENIKMAYGIEMNVRKEKTNFINVIPVLENGH
ncbi:MAG: heme ABC transporter ATP-binding protein [Candidatus Altiarchaeum hamiconexum]|mgnify:CR=1 FL=1|uniref:Heme ABC transporter ATP-binding protein n=1 Tax=Candidatus Altarchaeum hamiconexum TaxID=1803513 RepID=A0A8J7YYB7_9ARCH|nr:heme ABC transporter ATP-binding protein [Candidatus Altarchaeum hamiconexum]OIQ05510.1 MAG: hypothetical protein AUK59_03620 [Candidatus Altarchaeum sp. CG2_30_32_3053]PIN67562.1 MAG: heme ABC transporter ATP-binding protein [Candidatus Altarchaeum sp. CG12_big_fil_rev_8_21_14_0_65_33_22]PIV28925.1 MAG: heme ABC transporter ATP-binding protein [Candidatus Altarchaeum sp. CG03_land_8_20_14_0_80_32_618]PIX49554.1 MAG: heme ABC transporter ATP-binding protein [Candidatus Altarchaeum sp. CG_4_8